MAIPNCLSSVTRARAGFLTPLGVQHASCLIAIVQAIKADHPEVDPGLLRKDSGTRITMPDGTEVAQDIICFPDGHHFDCLHDGENAASPTWQDKGFVDADRYYRVPGSAPPPPPPPSDDCDEVRAQLRVVMGELAQATGALTACRAEHESARVEIERLLAEIERLKQEKPPCQCKIDGNATIARIFGIRCRPI